jgi:hypothetical protein
MLPYSRSSTNHAPALPHFHHIDKKPKPPFRVDWPNQSSNPVSSNGQSNAARLQAPGATNFDAILRSPEGFHMKHEASHRPSEPCPSIQPSRRVLTRQASEVRVSFDCLAQGDRTLLLSPGANHQGRLLVGRGKASHRQRGNDEST